METEVKSLSMHNLTEGNIYVSSDFYDRISSAIIFKFVGLHYSYAFQGKGHYINIQKSNFGYTSNLWLQDKHIRVATPDEIQWMDLCIKQNRFIFKDTIPFFKKFRLWKLN